MLQTTTKIVYGRPLSQIYSVVCMYLLREQGRLIILKFLSPLFAFSHVIFFFALPVLVFHGINEKKNATLPVRLLPSVHSIDTTEYFTAQIVIRIPQSSVFNTDIKLKLTASCCFCSGQLTKN